MCDDGRPILASCELCGWALRAGDRYQPCEDGPICATCAPTYREMLDDPGSFMDPLTGEELTAEQAQRICNEYLAGGGTLDDKALEVMEDEAEPTTPAGAGDTVH